MIIGHWDTFLVEGFVPTDWYGFIYLIINTTNGRSYIGKKNFLFKKRQRPLKDKKRDRISYVDSDWMNYTSSSKELNDDIIALGKDKFLFFILQLASGKCELTYLEEEYQYKYDVLKKRLPNGEKAFYNRTIAHKSFAGIEAQSEKSRQKISESLKKFHLANPGAISVSDETKEKLRSATIEYFANPENRSKHSDCILSSSTKEDRQLRAYYAQSFTDYNHSGIVSNGQKIGHENVKLSRGLFGQSEDEWSNVRVKGGRAAGKLPWWTNGSTQTRSLVCPGEGWSKGRLPKTQSERLKISASMKAYKAAQREKTSPDATVTAGDVIL